MKTGFFQFLSPQFSLGIIAVISAGTLSCDAQSDNPPKKIFEPLKIELTASEAQLTTTANKFALNFFTAALENAEAENVALSPFSLSMDLGMVLNGAAGETREAILKTIGLDNCTNEEVNIYFKKIWETLYKTDPSTTIAIANSIWYNKNRVEIKSEFAETCHTWYDALVEGLDYDSPNAVPAINQWCEDNTNRLIKDFVKSKNDLYDVNLLNALYFKGIWAEGFKFDENNTTTRSFHKENGQTTNVKMMFQKAYRPYYADEYLEYTTQPYGNKAYSMGIILPQENVLVKDVINRLKSTGYWTKINEESYSHEVDLGLPKFKVEYKNNKLADVLIQMGMGVACDESRAEFPHIADAAGISIGQNFYIANVTQQTYIKVNEEGTEAAAVTSIGMMTTSVPTPPIQFHADRPFLFVIQENSTGSILFIGKIGNPEE